MNTLLLLLVSLSLVWMMWLYTDPRPFHAKISHNFLIANSIMLGIVLPQVIGYFYLPLPSSSLDGLIVGGGIVLFFVGLGLSIWARMTTRNSHGRLPTQGPFTFSRNPVYLGILLLVFGFSLALRSSFLLMPVFLYVYFVEQIKKEERELHRHFGEKYEKYRTKVPRFFGIKGMSL